MNTTLQVRSEPLHRIVVTGMGIVSAIGNDAEQFEAALLLGRSGVRDNRWHDTSGFRTDQIGQVQGFAMGRWLPAYVRRHCSRVDLFALAATHEALERAELQPATASADRIGIVLGSGGAVANTEAYVANALAGGQRRPSSLLCTNPDCAGTIVAAHFGLRGPRSSIMTACSSGATAIGFAADFIREGFATVMLAGGVESLSYVTLSGFNALGALTTHKNRPFDRNRDGIVLGEAGAVMVLESYEHATARNAPILAEFISYGLTSDASHITAPHPEGDGMARAMEMALRGAGLKREEIGYINAHGTGTALNDKSETAAIKRVFGQHAYAMSVSTIKPMVGHTLSAAGAIEAAATVLSLKGQFVPPTLNYETPDPECDLDYVPNSGRNLPLDYAMSNSLAFGGNNTSLIFKRYEN